MADILSFEGVTLGVPTAAALVDASLKLADQLQSGGFGGAALQVAAPASRWALLAALGASTAMLAMASAKCTLDMPEEDISAVPDDEGNLVLRCGHSPAHEWDYGTGTRRERA